MNFKEAYETLELKFTSGNPIPVERSTILAKEWKAIKGELKKQKKDFNIIFGICLFFISLSTALLYSFWVFVSKI